MPAYLGAKGHCWSRGVPVPRLSPPSTAPPLISTSLILSTAPGLWMAVEASGEHLLPRTGLVQLCMEASSDSGGTYLRSLRVRMWAAGCREGPDLAPSATPIFSNSFQRLADGCQACLGSRNPYRESGGNPGYRTAGPAVPTLAILDQPWARPDFRLESLSSPNFWSRVDSPATGEMPTALPWGNGGAAGTWLVELALPQRS